MVIINMISRKHFFFLSKYDCKIKTIIIIIRLRCVQKWFLVIRLKKKIKHQKGYYMQWGVS